MLQQYNIKISQNNNKPKLIKSKVDFWDVDYFLKPYNKKILFSIDTSGKLFKSSIFLQYDNVRT